MISSLQWHIQQVLDRGNGFKLQVDLKIPASGCTVVFGPSGCGKSTLLRSVAGLEPGVQGRLALGERVYQDDASGVKRAAHLRGFGMVFQSGGLFPHLDVQGNLDYACRRHGTAETALQELVEVLELRPLLDRRSDQLSGGQRQRIALARAILCRPEALLLDEPLASLDRQTRLSLHPYFDQLRRDFSLPSLHVTHDLEEAARLGDRLILMQDGQVKYTGPMGEALTDRCAGLAVGQEACALLKATLVDGPDHDGLLRIKSGDHELWVPAGIRVPAREVRLLIRAQDVSLAMHRIEGSSILNVLPMTVQDLWPDDEARMMVRLRGSAGTLLAAVTRRSALKLELNPGREIFAQVKSLALL